jgi:hypothetical protein
MRFAASLVAVVVGVLAAGATRAGEAKCWFEHGAVVVPAAFADIAGDFILDLSTPHSQLHATMAQAHGIVATTPRGDLALAGVTIDDFAMQVEDLDARSQPFVTSIAGVLGADIARRHVIEIGFSPCRVMLRRRTVRPPSGATSLAVRWIADVPAVRASVCDNHRCESGFFAIDTASRGVRVAGAELSRRPASVDAASRSDPPARLRALSLGGRLFEQTPAGLMDPSPSPELAGAIGDAVWSQYDLTLDARSGRLELAPTAALVPDGAPDRAVAPVEKAGEDQEEYQHR